MYTLLVIIHVIVCLLMIGAILLQSGKGAEIGAAFGGSSQTVFGSRGPANFLSKFTVITAFVFMLTSLAGDPGEGADVFIHRHRFEQEACAGFFIFSRQRIQGSCCRRVPSGQRLRFSLTGPIL